MTERDSPRVSVILVGFNQEAYIEEAIVSILAQDYPNLQIVLSDDGSSDRTFALMRDAVANYVGPHDVRLNQTPGPCGVLQHIYNAVGVCDGELIVGAAGDDISLPNRVSVLAAAWMRNNAVAIFSSYTIIDANGAPLFDYSHKPNSVLNSYFPRRSVRKLPGATTAYDRSVFRDIALPAMPVFSEDNFLSLMINLQGGKIVSVDERLVLYRNHHGSFTNSYGSSIDLLAAEKKTQRYYLDNLRILQYFRDYSVDVVSAKDGSGKPDIDYNAVNGMIRYYDFCSRWLEMSFLHRLFLSFPLLRTSNRRWVAARMLGFKVLKSIKVLQRAMR